MVGLLQGPPPHRGDPAPPLPKVVDAVDLGDGTGAVGKGCFRLLFTVATIADADLVVRWRPTLRPLAVVEAGWACFDVLSAHEERAHAALWPTFLAAKAVGHRVQFKRARLFVNGIRVIPPAA